MTFKSTHSALKGRVALKGTGYPLQARYGPEADNGALRSSYLDIRTSSACGGNRGALSKTPAKAVDIYMKDDGELC